MKNTRERKQKQGSRFDLTGNSNFIRRFKQLSNGKGADWLLCLYNAIFELTLSSAKMSQLSVIFVFLNNLLWVPLNLWK